MKKLMLALGGLVLSTSIFALPVTLMGKFKHDYKNNQAKQFAQTMFNYAQRHHTSGTVTLEQCLQAAQDISATGATVSQNAAAGDYKTIDHVPYFNNIHVNVNGNNVMKYVGMVGEYAGVLTMPVCLSPTVGSVKQATLRQAVKTTDVTYHEIVNLMSAIFA